MSEEIKIIDNILEKIGNIETSIDDDYFRNNINGIKNNCIRLKEIISKKRPSLFSSLDYSYSENAQEISVEVFNLLKPIVERYGNKYNIRELHALLVSDVEEMILEKILSVKYEFGETLKKTRIENQNDNMEKKSV